MEQYYFQTLGTSKLNKIAALTLDKFETVEDDPTVWATKHLSKGWKPVK